MFISRIRCTISMCLREEYWFAMPISSSSENSGLVRQEHPVSHIPFPNILVVFAFGLVNILSTSQNGQF